jgi:hypothetical protein
MKEINFENEYIYMKPAISIVNNRLLEEGGLNIATTPPSPSTLAHFGPSSRTIHESFILTQNLFKQCGHYED